MTRDEQLKFGERLRNRRDALGFTQEFVSEQIGITLRFYQLIVRGEKSVSADTLIRLGQTMSVSIDYLLFGDLAHLLMNPIAETLRSISPHQRTDAEQI